MKTMGKKVKSLLKRTEKNENTQRNVLPSSQSRILSESSSNDENNSDCSDTPLIGV